MNAMEVLERLKTLLGGWRGVNEEGNPVAVTYSLTANGSVLVEQWFFHNGMEALTLYHLDGSSLVATHYCPIGNQPRLMLKRQTGEGVLEFEFVSATNLRSPEEEYEESFDLLIIDDSTMRRNETYIAGGVRETNGTTFHRERCGTRLSTNIQ